MVGYAVQPNSKHTRFEIKHKQTNKIVGVVEKSLVVKHLPDSKAKPTDIYHIRNQEHAPVKGFFSLDSAIKHSIFLHQKHKVAPVNKPSPPPPLPPSDANEHPMAKVGQLINDLGKALWSGSNHPTLNPSDHEKILHISKAHAALVKTFNDHYS